MARLQDREKAILLRKQEMSYSQIRMRLKVAKSTLGIWLKDYPLPPERIKELQHNEKRIEKYRKTMKEKREKRLQEYFIKQKNFYSLLIKEGYIWEGYFFIWARGQSNN